MQGFARGALTGHHNLGANTFDIDASKKNSFE
jgi:hypothetical protein